jgi:acetoin utilization deacetylase AcuC-like enzyme
MATVYSLVSSPAHEYEDHPERPARLDLLASRLETLPARRLEAVAATPEQVARVHDRQYIAALEHVCREQAPAIIDYAPTFVTPASYLDALLAAGGTLGCTQAVLNKEAGNAFAIVRPPGHHAEPGRAMGFCLFNNAAIAAAHALEEGVQRVLIIDFDAHHGNGTQAAFLNEERVAYFSTHQWGIYPGTGAITDAPDARKRIVNVPLPAFAGDAGFIRIEDQVIRPLFESFRPQFLLVSAGFDAHWNDPLTSLGVSLPGFLQISKCLVDLAAEFCQSKAVFVLEGGYNPQTVLHGGEAVFAALTGSADLLDPAVRNEISPYPEPDLEPLLEEIRGWHGWS